MRELAIAASIVSIVFAVFAIIIVLMLKKNVTDILKHDIAISDKLLENKMRAFDESFKLVDELSKSGPTLRKNEDFRTRAIACYNKILCTASDMRVADEFYALTISGMISLSPNAIVQYKLNCRQDMGFKTKGAKLASNLNISTQIKSNARAVASEVTKPTENPSTQPTPQTNSPTSTPQSQSQSVQNQSTPTSTMPQTSTQSAVRPNYQTYTSSAQSSSATNVNNSTAQSSIYRPTGTQTGASTISRPTVTMGTASTTRPSTTVSSTSATSANTRPTTTTTTTDAVRRPGRPRKSE